MKKLNTNINIGKYQTRTLASESIKESPLKESQQKSKLTATEQDESSRVITKLKPPKVPLRQASSTKQLSFTKSLKLRLDQTLKMGNNML